MDLKELIQDVQQGRLNALQKYVELKEMQSEIEDALKSIQPLAIDEADKYPEKSFKMYGALIEKRAAPATWDYANCLAYQQAKKRLKYIEDIAKAGGGADTDSGEIIDKAFKIEGKANIAVKILK